MIAQLRPRYPVATVCAVLDCPRRAYDYHSPPGAAAPVVTQLALTVTGSARPVAALVEDTVHTKTVEGLRVTMSSEQPLRVGEESVLTFTVVDAHTNTPATDLEPYLGALAHFVIVSEDGRDFLHAHPLEPTEMGGAPGHGGHEAAPHPHHKPMASDMAPAPHASAATVSAHTTFPRAGLYKVWAQFQRGGRVITVPFVVQVANGEPA